MTNDNTEWTGWFSTNPSACPDGPHRPPMGPNEDIAQCWRCGMPTFCMRPANETIGMHADACSLPVDHQGYCESGGEGHPPAEVVRGYWPGMDEDVAAARARWEAKDG